MKNSLVPAVVGDMLGSSVSLARTDWKQASRPGDRQTVSVVCDLLSRWGGLA